LLGLALGILEVVLRIEGNAVSAGTVVLVALLLIFGSQFTLFAMWFDMELYISTKRRFEVMVEPKRIAVSAKIFATSGNKTRIFARSRRFDLGCFGHSRRVPHLMA